MRDDYRLNFFVDTERMMIIIRPIGNMPGPVFVEQLFAAYAKVEAPWSYARLNDFRRFTGFLDERDLIEIATRWVKLKGRVKYKAFVAVVSLDAHDRVRLPSASKRFPQETICLFTDYHEAVGWLLASDKGRYLDGLEPLPRHIRRDDVLLD